MARTPLEPAFSINSVGGSELNVSVSPACGSSGLGAVMATPGMGPATVGAVGFELLAASHAPRAITATRASSPLGWSLDTAFGFPRLNVSVPTSHGFTPWHVHANYRR